MCIHQSTGLPQAPALAASAALLTPTTSPTPAPSHTTTMRNLSLPAQGASQLRYSVTGQSHFYGIILPWKVLFIDYHHAAQKCDPALRFMPTTLKGFEGIFCIESNRAGNNSKLFSKSCFQPGRLQVSLGPHSLMFGL